MSDDTLKKLEQADRILATARKKLDYCKEISARRIRRFSEFKSMTPAKIK